MSCSVGQITSLPSYSKDIKARAGTTGRGFFKSGNRRGSLSGAYFARPSPLPVSPSCRRNFGVPCRWSCTQGTAMKKLLVGALLAASFISFEARAQNRAGDAALGAVSGAVVLGPVGAVAGALIGYTAGPSIAHSWGVGRPASRSRARRATQAGPQVRQQAAAEASAPAPEKTSEVIAGGKTAPPVQGFE